jgi:hypothetical protein
MRRYYLTLSTFAGIVPGAYHICGRIRGPGITGGIDLECRATDEWGGKTIRFPTEALCIRAARTWFKRNAPKGNYADPKAIMTIGSHCDLDPQRVLCGPGELKRKANALWRQFEAGGGWDHKRNDDKTQVICDAWDKLVPRDYTDVD